MKKKSFYIETKIKKYYILKQNNFKNIFFALKQNPRKNILLLKYYQRNCFILSKQN